MKRKPAGYWIFMGVLQVFSLSLYGIDKIELATPNISSEAYALLELFYKISGQYIFTGQHNYPNTRDRNTQFALNILVKRLWCGAPTGVMPGKATAIRISHAPTLSTRLSANINWVR